MELTIMSYNIERGFHSKDHLLEEHRLQAAQRTVELIEPDLLALTEACYGGPNSQKIKMNYASLFNFQYGKFGGYPVFGPKRSDEGGNCLLSRLPLMAEVVPLAYKSAVRAQIPVDAEDNSNNSTVLMIDVVHPSYSAADDKKISTLEQLLDSRREPYILMGDFNTVHPEDDYDWKQLEEELQLFNPERAAFLVENWRQAKLVPWLLGLGLKDALPAEARTSTVPTNYVYGSPRRGVRMDFMFISPGITVEDAYIVKNKDTEIASDLYPMVGVFEIW